MLQNSAASLWDAVSIADHKSAPFISNAEVRFTWRDLLAGSALNDRSAELRDGSVLVATTDQLTAAAALIELDGMVRRIVLCPPDLPLEYLPAIVRSAAVNAIISDRLTTADEIPGITSFIHPDGKIVPGDRGATRHDTEWILLTSGTTGVPKLVLHTLATLAGAIEIGGPSMAPMVWSTFYDIRRYGGLQIFLRAILTNNSLRVVERP